MPNWCENYVTISGDTEVIKKLIETEFDFHTIKQCAIQNKNGNVCGKSDGWGCKWNRIDQCVRSVDDRSVSASFYFLTPWAPPCGVYETLQDMNVEVEALFFEPGNQLIGIFSHRKLWELDLAAYSSEYGSASKFFECDPLGLLFEEHLGVSQYFETDDEDDADDEMSTL